ncbi:MAG: radical SAM protein [Acidobacteria bacterium]|nr:radical SAM protein [Acidobacteriota bacterium]
MTRLLLCGVFKPFGVKDDTTEPLCTMELLNNQVTREQGIHSPRSNNPSFALYLMAENIRVPVTVLDFPTWEEFTREIDSGSYSHVGISFITPNVIKAGRMASYVRSHCPNTRIILGGHGTAIPELRELVDCDEICHGEGVSWLRKYFGEDENRPIVHPSIPSAINAFIYGAPIMGKAGIIIPGVGCQNSCRFCATSHKFDRKYHPFLRTGKDIFAACRKTEEELGVDDFGLMDENFCKDPVRARQLLKEMEKKGKAYTFSTFSSAEAITALGIDFLLRLGVNFLWIGVESKADLFEKTKGIDLHQLIADLQDHGISVLASAILFLEHHDKESIHEDIDWAIGLESDLLQFMELGPTPGTRLYKDYEEEGKIIAGIPWPRKHGQDEIWFRHPHFTLPETAAYLREAFIRKFLAHGPGVLNMAMTAIKGYLRVKAEVAERERSGLKWDPETLRYVPGDNAGPDVFMQMRLDSIKGNALRFRPALSAALKYAPNRQAAEKCRKVMALYNEAFGPMTIIERAKSLVVRFLAIRENRRTRKEGAIMRQPPTKRIAYPDRALKPAAKKCAVAIGPIVEQPEVEATAQPV